MPKKRAGMTSRPRVVKKPAAGAGRTRQPVWTEEEREAMREHARELQAGARRGKGDRADGERDVLAKIAALPEFDRSMAQRLHAIIAAAAPSLAPRTWYGMPAYARDDQVVCFFQAAHKFKARYATLGFSDKAHLDDGAMWPTSYALAALGPAEEAAVRALLAKAVG